MLSHCLQENHADCGKDQIGNQAAETDIGKKVIRHVDAVIPCDQRQDADKDEGSNIFPQASFFIQSVIIGNVKRIPALVICPLRQPVFR